MNVFSWSCSLDLSLSQTLDIFKLLTQTYSRYVDAPSRDAVEAVGTELVRRDELRGSPEGEPDESKLGVTEQILGWFTNEVGRISKRPRLVRVVHNDESGVGSFLSSAFASTDLFILLSWSCGLYTACLKCNPDFITTGSWNALVGVMTSLVDLLLDESIYTKKSIQKSALVRSRRALRSVRFCFLFR